MDRQELIAHGSFSGALVLIRTYPQTSAEHRYGAARSSQLSKTIIIFWWPEHPPLIVSRFAALFGLRASLVARRSSQDGPWLFRPDMTRRL
jgi:hypothetical protein